MDVVFDRSKTEMETTFFVPGQDPRDEDMEFPWISGGLVDFDGGNPGNFGAASLTSKSSVFGGGRRGVFNASQVHFPRK
jgi:hypothetical protein